MDVFIFAFVLFLLMLAIRRFRYRFVSNEIVRNDILRIMNTNSAPQISSKEQLVTYMQNVYLHRHVSRKRIRFLIGKLVNAGEIEFA